MTEKNSLRTSAVAPLNKLGEISVAKFLSQFWQQRPLLVRQAFAKGSGFAPLSNQEVLRLATYDEAQSRLIVKRGRSWNLTFGPFSKNTFGALNKSATLNGDKWTVLVQDTQHFSSEAHQLLAHFSFLPYSRIDDLMVSYASQGAGVGPHFDSYDVFLLQGSGRRRWQISAHPDQSLRTDVPLKILKKFKSEQEWVLTEGDMLYLPPGYAHNGIAETNGCVTWSIGFRAPVYQELLDAYLDHLRDSLTVIGCYTDAQRRIAPQPAFVDSTLRKNCADALASALSSAVAPRDIAAFIGRYLTQPKSHVSFMPPQKAQSCTVFTRRALRYGIRLDLRSRMLFDEAQFYLNGTAVCSDVSLSRAQQQCLTRLANERRVDATLLDAALLRLLHPYQQSGEIEIAE